MDQVIEFFKRTIQTSGTSVTRSASSFKRPENNQNKKSTNDQIPVPTAKSAPASIPVQEEQHANDMNGQTGEHDKNKDDRQRRWINGKWVYDQPPLIITTPPPQLPEPARPATVQQDWLIPVIFSSFMSTLCVLLMIVLIVAIVIM